MDLNEIGRLAKAAQPSLQKADSDAKNQVLHRAAELLVEQSDFLLKENEKDMEAGRQNGMPEGLLDRLLLTEERVKQMAEGLYQLEQLEDPIGEVLSMKKRPNGLLIGQKRVPLGVVGIIYEARPNVTADAFGLCFKTGNAVILKGGKGCNPFQYGHREGASPGSPGKGFPEAAVTLIEDTSRETTTAFMSSMQHCP